ncbi:MAG: D-alanyl-D-alanine carboxypeptidase [Synechococcales cyanobacterium M58_A2018_015]|nr:D-alanyl-D-alanine carboxypeptidase [Synechococcales cyanobacterium M58_A2018_015]
MLDIFAGLLSFFLSPTPRVEALHSADWSPWVKDATWVQSIVAPSPDPLAEAAVEQHLNALKGLGHPATKQGVWMQTGSQVLVDHQGSLPLSAASLTKMATTLVALHQWGPNHQFETLISATGPIEAGVVQGDLIVQGGSDPFFVWEEAIALGNALNQAGVRQVTGNLIITGSFAMNFEPDPIQAGTFLKQALNPGLWSAEIATAYQQLTPNLPRPQVIINGTVQAVPLAPASTTPLVRHLSMPLVDLLKAMNIYSNNVMAQILADAAGGAAVVAQRSAALSQMPAAEIQLINGSGLGMGNRISPRAAAAILIATQRYLQARDLSIADVYPIIGQDGGTLQWRETPPATIVKTGTLDEVSALAGVMPTRDRGLVWFTIVNLGAGELGDFHRQQDMLLQRLQQVWGTPNPLPPSVQSSNREGFKRLGATNRNQVLVQG